MHEQGIPSDRKKLVADIRIPVLFEKGRARNYTHAKCHIHEKGVQVAKVV